MTISTRLPANTALKRGKENWIAGKRGCPETEHATHPKRLHKSQATRTVCACLRMRTVGRSMCLSVLDGRMPRLNNE